MKADDQARLAELDAELAKVGLEGASVAALLRHHTNGLAATAGAWKVASEGWEARARAAEAILALGPITQDRLAEAMYACCLVPPRTDHAAHVLAYLARVRGS